MKKIISICTAAIVMTGLLSGFSSESDIYAREKQQIQIVTTIFPEYDWVMNILGDNPSDVEVTMLLDNGVDLHSYQPAMEDILRISTCDLFIYVGGESDEWVEDALKESTNKDMIVISLLDALGDRAKVEETVESMQEEEHDHEGHKDHEDDEDSEGHEDGGHDHEDGGQDHEDDGHDHEDGDAEYDEHVWLSLRNASALVQIISEALQKLDPECADMYQANTDDYVDRLDALDQEYQAAVDKAAMKTLLFGDRFPFRYLVDDYGLNYYAAFAGCSAETEASFETVVFLARKADELSLDTILTIEGSDQSIAETIRDNTTKKNQQIQTLNSLQSTNSRDVADGASYLSAMEENLSVLKMAMGCEDGTKTGGN